MKRWKKVAGVIGLIGALLVGGGCAEKKETGKGTVKVIGTSNQTSQTGQ